MSNKEIAFLKEYNSTDFNKKEGINYGVVIDNEQWDSMWINKPPKVDFEQCMVIYIYAYHPYHSGVYNKFQIAKIYEHKTEIEVVAEIDQNETFYKGGSTIISHIVVIPRNHKKVKFDIKGNINLK